MTAKATTHKKRAGDGGTYLVIADGTPEFRVALRYAANIAHQRRGHVAMAMIIEPTEFLGWGGVEAAVREEARKKAEAEMNALCAEVQQEVGVIPSVIIREGIRADEIIAISKGNPGIVAIIMGVAAESANNNPMISFFTAKVLAHLNVPLVIVPGHMTAQPMPPLA